MPSSAPTSWLPASGNTGYNAMNPARVYLYLQALRSLPSPCLRLRARKIGPALRSLKPGTATLFPAQFAGNRVTVPGVTHGRYARSPRSLQWLLTDDPTH